MNKKISVLGCGWLGKPLASHFVASGYNVKGSTRSISKMSGLASSGIEPFLLNLDNIEASAHDFLQSKTLIVAVTSKELPQFKNLLEATEQSPIEKVIFVSSSSVYKAENRTVTEETETAVQSNPLVNIEQLFLNSSKVKTTIIRFAGLFGYDRQPGKFFRSGKIVGDPFSYVNLIHRDDCIRLVTEIIRQEAWGEIFNGCAGTHPTKKEFYTKASRDIGLQPPVFDEHSNAPYKIVSNDKIKEYLDFTCRYDDLMEIDFSLC